jgi:hypothetical protein
MAGNQGRCGPFCLHAHEQVQARASRRRVFIGQMGVECFHSHSTRVKGVASFLSLLPMRRSRLLFLRPQAQPGSEAALHPKELDRDLA